MAWTESRKETLKKLWAEGLSASIIATRLGEVTRSAVIGKARRLGLAERRGGGSRPRSPRLIANRIRDLKQAKTRLLQAQPAPRTLLPPRRVAPVRSEPKAPLPPLEPGLGVSLLELDTTTCHWPIGDPKLPGFHFCGRPKPTGDEPYCPHHAALACKPAGQRPAPPALNPDGRRGRKKDQALPCEVAEARCEVGLHRLPLHAFNHSSN